MYTLLYDHVQSFDMSIRSFRPRKKILQRGLLARQSSDILKAIARFLSPASYLAMIGTCRPIRKLGDDDTFSPNHAIDVARICRLVFDENRNVFITGPAGTGKTYVMNMLYNVSLTAGRVPAMTATTGAASVGLPNGRTLHSFSGLRKGTIPIPDLISSLALGTIRPPHSWTTHDLLFIDEVSMNGARFMNKVDIIGRAARHSTAPLGGLQTVWSGDFMQLPPVGDKFPFTSDLWKDLNFKVVELRFPFRQDQDLDYYRMLQRIRCGGQTTSDIQFLEEKCNETKQKAYLLDTMEIRPTRLMSKNKDVASVNKMEFDKLESPIHQQRTATDAIMRKIPGANGVRAIYEQHHGPVSGMNVGLARAEAQAPYTLSFKDGAQYVLTFNIDVKKKLVNGSRCAYQDGLLVFNGGITLPLDKCIHTFSYALGDNLYLMRTQVALRLGYAVSIHSSQGMSLDCARIDIGKSIFCNAQVYVALSRVRNSKGLWIDNFDPHSIKVSRVALDFMQSVDSDSDDSDSDDSD